MSNSLAWVLILGGGYVGLYTAWGLQKRMSRVPMEVTVVEPNAYMTYQPLLPEVAGVEAIAELNELSKIALRRYPALNGWQPKWVLVEASDHVAVELGPKLSQWTLTHLLRRGIDVRLNTTMTSCVDGQVVLSDGESFGADTIVWTAGMKPNPILDATDAPRGPKGHVTGNAMLQIVREDGTVVDGAWAAGDIAQIPDLTAEDQPAYYVANAQNALRQAKLLVKNLTAQLQGKNLREYRHRSLGALASYGVGTGAAMVIGIRLRGLPAWLVDRAYHGMAMPTVARKYRVFAGWATNMFAPRDITALTNTEHPRRSFVIGMEVGDTDAPPRDSILSGWSAGRTARSRPLRHRG